MARTLIDIDPEKLARAQRALRTETKRDTVHAALALAAAGDAGRRLALRRPGPGRPRRPGPAPRPVRRRPPGGRHSRRLGPDHPPRRRRLRDHCPIAPRPHPPGRPSLARPKHGISPADLKAT